VLKIEISQIVRREGRQSNKDLELALIAIPFPLDANQASYCQRLAKAAAIINKM